MFPTQKITTCLWFAGEAEAAAEFYISLFEDSRIAGKTHYGKDMPLPEGTVLTVNFMLEGREFMALNGPPMFNFNEAVSMVVICETQAELDRHWSALLDGGKPQQCGWLKDRYGLSWQIVPRALHRYISDPNPAKRDRVMAAMMQMVKLDIAALDRAYAGGAP